MFQNFASYLLGYSYQTEGGPPAATEGVENNANTRLTAKEAEDDWIFVDQLDGEDNLLFDEELKHQDDSDILVVEDGTEDGCGDLGYDYDTIADASASMASSGGPLMSSTRSLSSLPGAASAVEESWFLTPPRCFISTGPPVNMATSPLENLLIEHPSMSVYIDPISSARREPEWYGPISDPSSESEEDDNDLKGGAPLAVTYDALGTGFRIMNNRPQKTLVKPTCLQNYRYQGRQGRESVYETRHDASRFAKDFLDEYMMTSPKFHLHFLRMLTPGYKFKLIDHLTELEKEKAKKKADYRKSDLEIKVETRARLAELDRIEHYKPRRAKVQDLMDTKHVDHNKLSEPQYKQVVAHERAQKVQVKKSYKAKSKGNMDRNNKAREVNCRNHRQRRGERSQGPYRSHANNNRKC